MSLSVLGLLTLVSSLTESLFQYKPLKVRSYKYSNERIDCFAF